MPSLEGARTCLQNAVFGKRMSAGLGSDLAASDPEVPLTTGANGMLMAWRPVGEPTRTSGDLDHSTPGLTPDSVPRRARAGRTQQPTGGMRQRGVRLPARVGEGDDTVGRPVRWAGGCVRRRRAGTRPPGARGNVVDVAGSCRRLREPGQPADPLGVGDHDGARPGREIRIAWYARFGPQRDHAGC